MPGRRRAGDGPATGRSRCPFLPKANAGGMGEALADVARWADPAGEKGLAVLVGNAGGPGAGGLQEPAHMRTVRAWLWDTYYIETSTGFLLTYLFLGLTVALLLGSAANVTFLAMYWTLNFLQRGMFSAIAILLDRERLRLLWAWPVYEFFSSLVLGGALTIAVIDQLRGTAMGRGRERRPAG